MLKNFELRQKLESFSKLLNLTGFKFVIALSKNKQLIENEISILDKIKEESKELADLKVAFSKKQSELATKDDNGRPKLTEDGRNVIMTDANQKKLEKFVKKLEEDNQEILKTQKEKELEFFKALDQPCEIPFVKIGEDDLPKDISIEQLDIISFMVDLK